VITTTLHPALDTLVPGPQVAARYVNRLVGGYPEFDTYEAALASGHNVLVHGPTGSGKTFSWKAFAATKGLPFYSVVMSGDMDFGSILGRWVPDEQGNLVWVDGVLTSMVREGRGVCLFDELNFGSERNLARFYSLWDDRREIVLTEHHGEVIKVPDGAPVVFGGAYNPGYHGTRPLSQALPNRFAFKMEFDYDPEVEAQLIPSPTLMEAAAKLRGNKRAIHTPVSTNMQVEFCEIAMAFDVDYALQNWAMAFPVEERASVAQVMDLHRDRIATEIEAASRRLDEEEG
jgi:MoxR-like ATPase